LIVRKLPGKITKICPYDFSALSKCSMRVQLNLNEFLNINFSFCHLSLFFESHESNILHFHIFSNDRIFSYPKIIIDFYGIDATELRKRDEEIKSEKMRWFYAHI
jgi:hypothetical protein